MGKLHEVLAVEQSLKTASDKIIKEAINTFSKGTHFTGQTRNYTAIIADTLQHPNEHKELDTTVQDKLDYVFEHVGRSLDCSFQKELTNQEAKGDIEVDGVALMKGVPATYLLSLESKLTELRQMFETIPTLEPGRAWKKNNQRAHSWVVDGTDQLKTEKVQTPLVLYPATDKHPAQVQVTSLDKIVGKYSVTHYSGALSVDEKSALLGKLDNLLREVKKARMRANATEVKKGEISKVLVDYLVSTK